MNYNFETVLKEDSERILKLGIPWYKIKNKKILITGGNSFIVSYFIKILFLINIVKKLNITIDCTTRDKKKKKIYTIKDIQKNF